MPATPKPQSDRLQVLICAALAAAAAYFFVTNVSQYYFTSDDAYISFIYARHLAEGNGLVWNPGEFVEGYTNFLWVLLMSGSLFVGIDPVISANVLGISCSVLLLVSLLYFFARVYGWRSPWAWLPLVVLSLSRSYTAWSTSGLETMLFTLLVFWGVMLFIYERENSLKWPVFSSLVLAAATLVRPDAAVIMFVVGLAFLADMLGRKRSFRTGVIWAAPYIAIVGAHFAWRYAYYGFLLPNTFYAKVSGVWLAQGLNYLELFAANYQFYWFLPFVLLAVLVRRNFLSFLFLSILAFWAIYILYVGGDIFEFRFLVVVFPFLYWLVVDGLAVTYAFAAERALPQQWPRIVALVGAAALLWTTDYGSNNPVPRQYRSGIAPLAGMKDYADSRADQGKFIRSMINAGVLPDNFVIGVGGAGALPYYANLPTVDRRGLNDVKIARIPVTRRGRIGHERDAPYDYLVEREVAVFDLYNQLIFPDKSRLDDVDSHYFRGDKVAVRAIELDGKYLIFATFVSDAALQNIFRDTLVLKPG